MAEETAAPAAPAAAPPSPPAGPLAEAPLAEYVERRERGERSTGPAAPPAVEPPLATEPAAEAPPSVPGETPEQTAAAKASRTRGELQRRLDSLQAQLGYSTRQMERLQRERDDYAAKVAAAVPAPEPAPSDTGPDGPILQAFLDQGKTYEDWIDARIAFRAQKIADERIAQLNQQASQAHAQATLEQAIATFPERADAVKAKHPDFDTVVADNDTVVLSPVMQDVCMRADKGAEYMYWLGKHPDQANQLGEITRAYGPQAFPLVEFLLQQQIAETAHRGVPAVAPTSAAPPPITPLGGGSTNAQSPTLDTLPLGEYIRRRNAEAAAKRNGGR